MPTNTTPEILAATSAALPHLRAVEAVARGADRPLFSRLTPAAAGRIADAAQRVADFLSGRRPNPWQLGLVGALYVTAPALGFREATARADLERLAEAIWSARARESAPEAARTRADQVAAQVAKVRNHASVARARRLVEAVEPSFWSPTALGRFRRWLRWLSSAAGATVPTAEDLRRAASFLDGCAAGDPSGLGTGDLPSALRHLATLREVAAPEAERRRCKPVNFGFPAVVPPGAYSVVVSSFEVAIPGPKAARLDVARHPDRERAARAAGEPVLLRPCEDDPTWPQLTRGRLRDLAASLRAEFGDFARCLGALADAREVAGEPDPVDCAAWADRVREAYRDLPAWACRLARSRLRSDTSTHWLDSIGPVSDDEVLDARRADCPGDAFEALRAALRS